MKTLLVALLVGAVSASVDKSEWNSFRRAYGKSYSSPVEEVYRMKVYADNKAFVEKHMKEYAEGKHTYTVGLNKFADLTNEEFNQLYKGLRLGSSRPHMRHQKSDQVAPASLDWRDRGAVTSIKDQGPCGSCWAFSVAGALEGAWVKWGNSLVNVSAQQMMDCSWSYGNQDCNGGWMDTTFQYIHDNGGIQSEEQYPYQQESSSECLAQPGVDVVATVAQWADVPKGDEDALLDAVLLSPVAVAVDATHISFQLYTSGIYDEPACSSDRVDHTATAIGYGTENGTDYWLLKNSWGTGWGNAGYIKMSRNKNNQCGIATLASYVTTV